jgi:hypothetical protein
MGPGALVAHVEAQVQVGGHYAFENGGLTAIDGYYACMHACDADAW